MQWKDIEGYEGLYQISDEGQVKSLLSDGKLLKPSPHPQGYMRVNLSKNGSYKTLLIHRIVGKAFIDNPHGLFEINHIDENKTNNSIKNLEWVTSKQNNNHGTRIERCIATLNKKVKQMDLNGMLIREFDSIKHAGTQSGIYPGNICKCCKGKLKTIGGYKWKYI